MEISEEERGGRMIELEMRSEKKERRKNMKKERGKESEFRGRE